jgi:hypothetical protein
LSEASHDPPRAGLGAFPATTMNPCGRVEEGKEEVPAAVRPFFEPGVQHKVAEKSGLSSSSVPFN